MSSEKKDNRGGARTGAGRKEAANKKQAVSIYLQPELAERLRKEKSRSEVVEKLLREYYSI